MTKGDRSGAARALMGVGEYGDAATMTDTFDRNQKLDARAAAGLSMTKSNYGQASGVMYAAGDLAEGQRLEGEGRNRKAGAMLLEDPRQAAAITAAGGDIQTATQLLDWSQRAAEAERTQALTRARTMAPILNSVGQLPYEQRRIAIQQQSTVLGGAGFTTEQLAQFDPTDQNIRALTDSVLGLEKVLGSYIQREVGDEIRTYRTNPYGVLPVGKEAVPYSREEARQDRRLDQTDAQQEITREQINVANSTGDVYGPLLQRYAQGEQLNPQEQEIVRSILAGRNGGNDWGGGGGVPGLPGVTTPMGANGVAMPNQTGTRPNPPSAQQPSQRGNGQSAASPAVVRSADDFERLPVGAWFTNPADGRVMQKAR